ncbi:MULTISPECIES: hypothetical protein [Glutamicibacter]|uniref:hypothetical protein n=1 Tax=Glutamicibacter TaxID=1742989 RepID=UPI0012FF59A7|nr:MULTISPECIES: hypothetical protein [Glutamicibacter]
MSVTTPPELLCFLQKISNPTELPTDTLRYMGTFPIGGVTILGSYQPDMRVLRKLEGSELPNPAISHF